MSIHAKLEQLIRIIGHAVRSSGLSELPSIVCAMAQMRDAVRDPSVAKRVEENILNLRMTAPEPAHGLLRSMAWIARSVNLNSTTLAELAVPRLCAEAVKVAELNWQGHFISQASKAVAA
jgi:hypothetical protein